MLAGLFTSATSHFVAAASVAISALIIALGRTTLARIDHTGSESNRVEAEAITAGEVG